ncbi:autotransporter domain-containing protein [Brucellaceae bacterium C25G]
MRIVKLLKLKQVFLMGSCSILSLNPGFPTIGIQPALAQACPANDCTGDTVVNANSAGYFGSATWYFRNNTTVNLTASNAMTDSSESGGFQDYTYFYNNSTLNVNKEAAISGGLQEIIGGAVTVNVNAVRGITGGQMTLRGATLNVFTQNGVTDEAYMVVGDNGVANFMVANAYSSNNSLSIVARSNTARGIVNASATGAINSDVSFQGGGILNILAHDALVTTASVFFGSNFGVDGGTMLLNGYNQSLYTINYSSDDKTAIIANNGAAASTLTLIGDNNPRDWVFKGDIKNSTNGATGVLNLVKSGAHTMTLSGKSTYTGSTTLNAGILRAGSSTGLAANTAYRVSGGELDLSNYDLTMSSLSGTGGTITLGSARLTVDQTAHTTYAGTITGTGSLVKSGAGTLTLSNANTWTGGTTIDAGKLTTTSASGLASNSAYVVNGGTLDLNNYALTMSSLSGTGGTITLGSANLTLNQGMNTTYAGAIAGTGSVTKQGAGNVTLAGVNSYSGGTSINAGTLTGTTSSFGSGNITNNAQLIFSQNTNGTFAGSITGTGSLTKTGSGTVKLSGNTSHQGNTTISGGVLDVGGTLTIGAGKSLLITSGTADPALLADKLSIGNNTNFNLSGITDQSQLDKVLIKTANGITGDFASVTIGGFAGTVDYMTLNTHKSGDGKNYLATYGLSWTAGNNLAHGTFTLADASNEIDIGVALSNQTANTATNWNGQTLTKAGAGTLILSANNTYSGGTRVNAGTLQIGNGGTTGSVLGAIANNGTLVFNRSNEITAANIISGTGNLVQAGSSTLILTGTNTYSGGTTIDAGTLSISADHNLGATDGGITFNGGQLSVTGTFDSARALVANTTATFNVATGNTFGVTGQVSGTGSLLKTGGGTLRLDNTTNNYENTLIAAGTLIGNAASISGDVGNAGTLVFNQASDLSFAGNIVGYTDGGVETKGDVVKQGAGTLTLQGTSTLDWSIAAGGVTTVAERFGGNVSIDAGSNLTFEQIENVSAANVLTGEGTFFKNGTGTLLMTADSSSFAGLTKVNAGKFVLNGKLGGSLDVASGGTLGGNGIIGSGESSLVSIASGGILAPGNSIGTLTVNGDLLMASGSIFKVEVDPAGSAADLVQVTGAATLQGGTVAHIGSEGEYNLRSRYTILSAAGGLTGTFGSVTTDFAFLDPSLIYDQTAGTVDLTLHRNDIHFADKVDTVNQIATATVIENIGVEAASPIFDAIALLPDNRTLIGNSVDQLSGEAYASARGALLHQSGHIRMTVLSRLQQAFGDVPATQIDVLAYDGSQHSTSVSASALDAAMNAVDPQPYAAWGSAFGGWATQAGDGNAHESKTDIGGFTAGIDVGTRDNWRFGLLTGYSRSTFKTPELNSSGSSDNYTLGTYAGTETAAMQGAIGVRAGLAYTWHNLDMSRTVAFQGFDDKLSADYNGGTFQVFGELGYKVNVAPRSIIEPYANLAYVRVKTDGFNEQGQNGAALNVESNTSAATLSTLGMRASTSFELGGVTTTARADLGWRHAYGSRVPLSTASFSGSDVFTISGTALSKDMALIGAGLDFQLSKTTTLGVIYQGQFGSGSKENAMNVSLSVRF